jgi:ABC-type transport system involved in cytochrome bd biosynthesis fused ATPase/permease subunit
MRELQAFNVLQQATPQSPQQAIKEAVSNTAAAVAQVLSDLMKMSPQEREKVLNEALAKISEQFPQLKQYMNNFRPQGEHRSSE